MKFFRLFDYHEEIGLTACAVLKVPNDEILNQLEVKLGNEKENFSLVPNQRWNENPEDPFAWVKIYNSAQNQSVTRGRIQKIEIPMVFFGNSGDDCWGELQIRTKIIGKKEEKFGPVVLGRNRSFDSRIGQWVLETKPIVPKSDQKTHAFLALRFYHAQHKPIAQPDWRFEPSYVCVDEEFFYQIEVEWFNTTIAITVTLIERNSQNIPNFMKR